MTANTFAAYDTAKQRISKRRHTEADEALVVAWENGAKLIVENKRLVAQAEERKKLMDEAMARVRMLVARNEVLETRGQVPVSLESILEGTPSKVASLRQ